MPLLEIRYLAEQPDMSGAQAVLLTSANGARALAQATVERDIAVYAVGDATAREASDLGFATVTSAAGDVDRLTEVVANALDPEAGRLVHVAAHHVAGNLAETLSERGFEVERVELYEAVAHEQVDPEVEIELREGGIHAVLFFSPRTALAFVNLVRHAHLEEVCGNLEAVCLSEAVAKEIETIAWHGVAIAAHPNQESLLAVLDRVAWSRSTVIRFISKALSRRPMENE